MLLLVLTGLVAIVQSKTCYCGDGNSYYESGSSTDCWEGMSSLRTVHNIKGSWEVACRKCSAKAAEHYYNDGPPKTTNIFGHGNVEERCWVCVHNTWNMKLKEYVGKTSF